MRFDINSGERVGDAYYFDQTEKKLLAIDLDKTSLDQIIALFQEFNSSNQRKYSLFYIEYKNNIFKIVKKPVILGGDASDLSSDMCSDIFGNIYITGKGKSYKNNGGVHNRLFIIEIDRDGKKIGKVGWQGSFRGSHGNAIAILPGRRLVVGGQYRPDSAGVQHFPLGLAKNDDPRIFFDEQSNTLYEIENPNGRLESNERGWYMLRVENKHEYVTSSVININVQSNKSWVRFPQNLYLSDIPPLSGISIALPVEGIPEIPKNENTVLKLTLNVLGKEVSSPIFISFNH
jgi:hypothetical protein